ncbi:MAG TPA: 1-(5-phosphoribosyl)-5-[(5-phosphoribosylamino)methylideneamino]imidazole-4-carboxamide isomerase [Solirubrobacteraceae bacterium]|nr:1-(5-phosphoribosyl)-5-[(5-phosphoribosylamino)methylideneamino]imidazole-4-carboxamide isomerase [Solirubrobacteraceae bacterium]
MNLYPAIDILGGNAVRLVQGDFDAQKVYDEDPLAAARGWKEEGARYLHMVDLDGARAGFPQNLDHLGRVVKELDVPVQFGGGLRALTAIEDAIGQGAERVILGTAAFTDPILLGEALGRWPGRVLVSVDVREGRVVTEGWIETVDGSPEDVIAGLLARGASQLVYTNVDRDGMLGGPDLQEVRRVAQAAHGGSVIYSGGIGRLTDLEGLAGLGESSLEGVIVGKALYERRFTIAQAHAALAG